MSIPLCITPVEDKMVWPFTASGEYSVKSGYNFLAMENMETQAPRLSVQGNEIWKLVWGLWIPNKVKNFIWRLCRDAIPVKKNLKKRQILQDESCDHCHQVPETTCYMGMPNPYTGLGFHSGALLSHEPLVPRHSRVDTLR